MWSAGQTRPSPIKSKLPRPGKRQQYGIISLQQTLGGSTTYRTLSPKRTPFQIGIDWRSRVRKVPRRRWISHTHPVWLWGCSPCKISSSGPIFHGTKWLLWRPHIQSPTLHSRCGINKGLIKSGSTIDHWRSRCKGWILWRIPYTYIHTYNRLWPDASTPPGYIFECVRSEPSSARNPEGCYISNNVTVPLWNGSEIFFKIGTPIQINLHLTVTNLTIKQYFSLW
jgi:hypothetical protein